MPSAVSPVAPLPAHTLLVFLLQVAALLLLALCLGRLAVRIGLPALVGELLTGVLLGPSVLGQLAPVASGWLLPARVEQMHLLDAVGQLGMLLLVGVTGAHLDLGTLRRQRATVLRISLGGLLLPLALGVGLGLVTPATLLADGGDRVVFACFVGVAMSATAIPVIAKTLADMRLLHRDVGQLILVAGMVDDALAWVLLAMVSAVATAGISAGTVGWSLLGLAAAVLLPLLVGRRLVRLALGAAARAGDSGPLIATTVGIVLLGAAGTHALGLEAVLGAFVAGLLVGARGTVDPARLAPLRTVVLSVLAPLFLASAGLRMDLTALADPVVLLAAVAALLVAIAGKFGGAYLGARTSRMTRWEGVALGAGMNARGVVEVVVAMVGLRLGVLTERTFTIVVLIAIVTSLMAPPILRLAMTRVEQTADEQLRAAEQDAWSVPAPRAGRATPPERR